MRGLPPVDLAIIIPSTGRAEQCARLVDRIYATTARPPHVTISIEPDDVKPYARALTPSSEQRQRLYAEHGSLVGLTWDQTGMAEFVTGSHVAAINRAASAPTEDPDVRMIIKLDDDHWPLTRHWDQDYLNALDQLGGTGVVYGNDLLQGERLPTVPGLSTNIVLELGWYAPPQLEHWHCDDFWRELGARAGRLKYLPETIIEHRHPQAGKAQRDAIYAAGGENAERIARDGRAWAKMTSRSVDAPAGTLMDTWAARVRALARRDA